MKKILLSALYLFTVLKVAAQGVGCPQVTASPDQTLPCSQECTQISATVFEVGETNTYNVISIPHAPPIAYNAGGGTAISVNTDDVWSNVITLPFPFCFFGDTYTQAKVGSNGAIKLGPIPLTNGGYHPWPFSASVPSPALVDAGNIFGPYHDIDPSVAGTVRWYLTGQAPCRTFIVSFNNLGHYSCTNLRSTHMMVLYETTNVIEVYVERKQTCNSWNSGNTVIGIQNNTGTVGFTPPGRNTGNWTVNTPEAWRFVPAGAPIYTPVQWFEGTNLVGTGNTITVCPTGSSTYTARTVYTRCDGLQIPAEDQVSVNYTPNPLLSVNPVNPFSCSGQNITLTASSPTAVNYSWSSGQNTPVINVAPVATTTYTVTATNPLTGCQSTASTTVNIAQPTGSSCNVLYVTPTGSPSGDGTKSNPMNLSSALIAGACNGTIIKMAIGDYVTDTTITGVTSFLTLEGGFNPAVNWEKVSTVGATRILKTATMTTSLANGSGIIDENGLEPRSTAVEISSQSGFRFQDLTIQVASLANNSPILGYRGVSTKGIQINNSNNYNIVRTNVVVGGASNGSNSWCVAPATNGGSSFGIDLVGNGANGSIISSNINSGTAGTGGTGCLPTYANGANGIAQAIRTNGTGLATNQSTFNLAGQPVIRMDDVSCTELPVGFRTVNSNNWSFDTGSNPATASGNNVSTIYSTIGRKNINYAGNSYVGFANIIIDDLVLPAFTTSAPFIQGQYRVCVGESVTFTATNGGVGYIYIWSVNGDVVASSTNAQTVTFPTSTPGIFNVQLNFETSCCGISLPSSLVLHVENRPQIITPPDENLCLGDLSGVSLTVSGALPNGTIQWSPATGLNNTNSETVIALPQTSTTYSITLTDSTGLCSDVGSVTVNVIDLVLTPASTPASCVQSGTASVAVSGGSGSYSYLWQGGETTSSISNLQPGNYQVLVTDNILGCTDSITVNVLAGPGALVGNISATNVSCAGENNGTATIEITGGTPPYTYSWSPLGGVVTTTDLTQTITNLPPNTYAVNIADAQGCEFDASIDVNEPSPIVMILDSLRNSTCSGVSDGFIRIQSDGGLRPYSFQWNTGMAVVEINDGVNADNLLPGTYILTLTDALNCEESLTVEVLPLNTYTGNLDTILCFDDSFIFNGTLYNSGNTSGTEVITASNGCDSTVTVNVTILDEKLGNVDTTLCFGESVTINGTLYNTTTVNATEIFTNIGPQNCDSTVTVNVTILDEKLGNLDTTLCFGESITINGTLYNTTTVNATEIFTNIGPQNCDSTVTVNVTILDEKLGSVDTTLCFGESITINGTVYNTSTVNGTEIFTNIGPQNCDSTVTVNVTILDEKLGNVDTTLCFGESITINGTVYNTTTVNGTEIFTNIGPQNCDSTVTVNVTILDEKLGNVDTTLCFGESITINGTVYNTTTVNGTEIFTNIGPQNCDSTVTVNVTILDEKLGNVDTILCFGESVTINGTLYNTTTVNATEIFTNIGPQNCDSTVTVNVTILDEKLGNVDTILCFGESVTINGTLYNTTTVNATEIFTNIGPQNCDSTVTVNVTILDEKLGNVDTTLCFGESITINGTVYNTTTVNGTEIFTNIGSQNCDSTVTVNVTILDEKLGNVDTTLCFGESITINGTLYNTTTVNATEIFTNIGPQNCDSTVTVNVTILDEKLGNVDTTLCFGESITINGTVYNTTTVNGTEIFTNIGPQNCDSTVTVNVTILDEKLGNVDTTLCFGESITINGTVYSTTTVNGTEIFTNIGPQNCDSTVTVNVTILDEKLGNVDTTLCFGESITINGTLYNTTTVNATEIFTNIGPQNCDSTVTVNVTILDEKLGNVDTTLCFGESITINGTLYNTTTVNATEIFANIGPQNCDSTFTVNVTILDEKLGSVDTTLCFGESITINGTLYNTTTVNATEIFTNVGPQNCDSTVTVNVTILDLPTLTIPAGQSICQGTGTQFTLTGTPNAVVFYNINGGGNLSTTLNSSGQATLSTGVLSSNTTYNFVSVQLSGQTSCLQQVNQSLTVSVNPSFSQTVGATICSNESYTLPNGQVVNTAGVYPVSFLTAAGCDSTITTTLTVNQLGVSNPLTDISVCEGFSETITVNAQNMVSYEWFYNVGFGNQSTIGESGFSGGESATLTFNLLPSLDNAEISVRMTDACGNVFNESFNLRVFEPTPVENPVEDLEICVHELPTTLTVDYNGYNYVWDDGTTGPTVQITGAGEYVVNFFANVTNCRTSDTIVVTTEDCIANCVVLAPTGFTPDENGRNDIFRVVTNCDEGFSFFEFRIYNRWGELVYLTNNHRQGWDGNYKGRTAEIGVYTYYVEYVKNLTNKSEIIKGNVTLIR